ncbi:MAG: hypothetical protein QNJ98_14140 [Planctomycetota bacterium]|nr:hypothetical protein [Planctomycetota bacterium]
MPGPDRLFALGSRATRLAKEYGALQRAILDFCDEMPKDVLARGDVARVMRRIQEASAYAQALADKILDGPPAAASPFELEALDARGLVDAVYDGVRRVMGKKVCLHKQIARPQQPIHGHRQTLELVFSSLLLLSAASMPTGGRIHLFVGPDAWANTRPKEIQDGPHVRVRLVDNGSPWASALRGRTGMVGEGMQQTVAALAEAIARSGAHLTCAKARDAGNTVELLLRAAD